MSLYLGIDTSNYTTSLALYDGKSGQIQQKKKLLPVKEGALGLRQSDALFHHVKQLPDLAQALFAEVGERKIAAIGVSTQPRRRDDSYMPCFWRESLWRKQWERHFLCPYIPFPIRKGMLPQHSTVRDACPGWTNPLSLFIFPAVLRTVFW